MSQEAITRLDQVHRQLQQMERQLASLEQSMLDAQQAVATLEAFEEGQADGAVLLPVGAGVHVRATLHRDQPVLRSIGAETAVDGTAEEAVAAVKARRDALAGAFQETAARMERLSQEAQQLQQQIT